MEMTLIVASVRGGNSLDTIESWKKTASEEPDILIVENEGDGPIRSYQHGFENTEAEILGFLHDDLYIYEQEWDKRVLAEFEDSKTGVVGFGGGWGHGTPDIGFNCYHIAKLQRLGYCSNSRDAEHHGSRFTGSCEVAVLDGYALFVRRELLNKSYHIQESPDDTIHAGGWPVKDLTFHCYDYWLCAMSHRLGYSIRMVGIDSLHQGGQTSTNNVYLDWLRTQGLTDQDIHSSSHVLFYNEFTEDELPFRVPEDKRFPGWDRPGA